MSPELRIRQVNWTAEHSVLSQLRRTVFIEEQSVPEELEWDNDDETSIHFLALLGDTPVGTARLTPDGQIGRMAVLKQHRHKGIASTLLKAVLDRASQSGLEKVFLHAQADVVPLYEQFGFIKKGDIFLEASIEHQAMYKSLDKNT